MDDHDHAPNQYVSPEQYVSIDGWALIWITTILLVPAIFGVMFLPPLPRFLVLVLALAGGVLFSVLYSWAIIHPASTTAHVLDRLHIGPPRPGTPR